MNLTAAHDPVADFYADHHGWLQGFAQRAGWSELPAVKTKRVYGVYQGAARSILDYTMVQFMAKALYPTLFKDIDPQAKGSFALEM